MSRVLAYASTHSSISTKSASTILISETSSKLPCSSIATKYRTDSIEPSTGRTSWMHTLASEGSRNPVLFSVARAHLVNSVKVRSWSEFGSLVGLRLVQQNGFDILAV